MNSPRTKSPSAAAPAANIWLAIGDETGAFENPLSSGFHGAALILARPAALAAALDEHLNESTIRQRMKRAIGGLENRLRNGGAEKIKELERHHVREAWDYFKDGGIKGHYRLDEISSDPVLANLLAAFRWLSRHPDIISVGAYGSGSEVLTDFWKGSDPMSALGAVYGRALALVKPFLGPAPRIRVLPGRRSEEIDSAVIRRAGQNVSKPGSSTGSHSGQNTHPDMPRKKERQTSSVTGGNRVLLDAMESVFWETLGSMGDYWPVPSSPSARKMVFSPYTEKAGLVAALEFEDKVAARLVNAEEKAFTSLADLACSLMAASCDSTPRDLRIIFPDPVGPNIRFFPASEVLK